MIRGTRTSVHRLLELPAGLERQCPSGELCDWRSLPRVLVAELGRVHPAVPERGQRVQVGDGGLPSAVHHLGPDVTPTAPPTTVGDCPVTATWVHTTADIGSTTWTVTSGGLAQETGIGNATGTAALAGKVLTITFVASDKVTTGVYSWTLTPDCRLILFAFGLVDALREQ